MFRKGSLTAGAKRRFDKCLCLCVSMSVFLTSDINRIVTSGLSLTLTLLSLFREYNEKCVQFKVKRDSYAFPLWNKLSAEDRSLTVTHEYCLQFSSDFVLTALMTMHYPMQKNQMRIFCLIIWILRILDSYDDQTLKTEPLVYFAYFNFLKDGLVISVKTRIHNYWPPKLLLQRPQLVS